MVKNFKNKRHESVFLFLLECKENTSKAKKSSIKGTVMYFINFFTSLVALYSKNIRL